jgi:hypothetical protein
MSEAPEPYRTVGEKAHFYKAVVQMGIGVVGTVGVLVHLVLNLFNVPMKTAGQRLFVDIGLTLGVAAAVELAYTLFTHGADEAVDPIMLGLAAAMLIQFGQVEKLSIGEGVAAVLYVAALGGLFAIRDRLARSTDPPSWSPPWWRAVKTRWQPTIPDGPGANEPANGNG